MRARNTTRPCACHNAHAARFDFMDMRYFMYFMYVMYFMEVDVMYFTDVMADMLL